MSRQRLSLASDNQAPVHPQIFRAMNDLLSQDSSCYDTDSETKKLFSWLKDQCGEYEFATCATGTAANVLALGSQLFSHESVLCQTDSHLAIDSCSALEKNFGIKAFTADGHDGFIDVATVQKFFLRRGDQHFAQLKAIHIAWPDERGRCMPLEQLAELRKYATQNHLFMHLDGARLFNGLELFQMSLVDILKYFDSFSLGGSKNGLMFGELFGVKKPMVPLKYLKKQHLNLLTKTKYLSAQFLEYLTTPLAFELAQHSRERASEVESLLNRYGFRAEEPVETNMVFAHLDPSVFKAIKKELHVFQWKEEPLTVRFVTSWSTSQEHILALERGLQNWFNENSLTQG